VQPTGDYQTMSDYTFDPSDFADGEETDMTENTKTDGSSIADSIDGSTIGLLPLTIVAVYAFVEKAVVLAAIEGIVGSTGLATAITTAFYVAGAISVGVLGVALVITVLSLLLALAWRSPAHGIIGGLGVVVGGVLYGLATFVFTGVPTLVGVVIGFNALVYGGLVLVMGGAAIVGLLSIE